MIKNVKNAVHAPQVAPARPLTEEEKKAKIMQFLQQKRESFALNILCNLVHGDGRTIYYDLKCEDSKDVDHKVVDIAVSMADNLIEKLYPLPEETKDKEDK